MQEESTSKGKEIHGHLINSCYFRHYVQCQVQKEDIQPLIDVPQLIHQEETNLLTDRQARQKLQEKTSDFQVTFDDCVYLSLGLEAKRDIYNTFDPDKPFNVHLDPPSTECPQVVEIKQEGKASVYTTDFYFTNKLPSNITAWSPGENNTMLTADQAAAADPILFDTGPLQPGEICLHSWMLYTSQAPVLDLTGEHIKIKEDIEATFHTLNLCPKEEEVKSSGRKERRASKSK